jgi:hypothetical protein
LGGSLLKLCQIALPSIQDDCCFTIKVKMSSNLSAATWHGVDQHIFEVFSQFIPIGHIMKKKITSKSSAQKFELK